MSKVKLTLLLALLATQAGVWAQTPPEFEPCVSYPLSQQATTVAIKDVNGDWLDDVVVTAWPSVLFVFYQQQDGTLGQAVQLYAPNMPNALAIADLDRDGRSDVIVGGSGGELDIYYQQPDGALGLPETVYAYGYTSGIVVGDFNSDGLPDIAVSTSTYPAVFLLLQSSAGGFDLPAVYGLAGTNARSICALDFNSDGKQDLAVLLNDQAAYLIQNAAGELDAPEYLPATWAYSMAAGDVTGDNRDDLVFTIATNRPDAVVAVYAQGSPGAVPTLQTYPAYDYAEPLALMDVNGDGRADIVTAHAGWAALTVFHQLPDGTLGPYDTYTVPYCNDYQPGALAAGDLNSDGLPDLALTDPDEGLVVLTHVKQSDTVPPLCSASVTGTPGENGWHVSPVTVEITAEDNAGGSGVKAVYYTLDGANWLAYSGPVAVSDEGVRNVGYYAQDVAGNNSEVQWLTLKLDRHAPNLTLQPSITEIWPPSGAYVDIPVTVAGVDQVSGLANLHLKVVDEYGLVQPEKDVTGGTVYVRLVASRRPRDFDGRAYTLILTGTDVAGNVGTAQSTITVPHEKPKHPKNNVKGPKK